MDSVTRQMPKCVIYGVWCLCHPERGFYYIGQTIRGMNSRWYHHLWSARITHSRSYHSRLSKWIRKHSAENIVFSIIEVCSTFDIDYREKFWISHFRALNQAQANILEGGSQPKGHKRPNHSKIMSGSGNPMYGKNRSTEMAYARTFQGSPSEETRRKMGESHSGSKNGRAKLTEVDVLEIRSRYAGAWPRGAQASVAREFGVTHRIIREIVNRTSWKHVN